jgi:3-dehydroquinate dehydratase-2
MAEPTILVLNGPNLNMLGKREPAIYGATTLADIEAMCAETARAAGLGLEFRQSNHEGELVTWCQEARERHAGIVINAGAYTHTSVALRDALIAAEVPAIEVHISNIYAREPFRHHSFLSAIAVGVICGLGPRGYVAAIEAMAEIVKAGQE